MHRLKWWICTCKRQERPGQKVGEPAGVERCSWGFRVRQHKYTKNALRWRPKQQHDNQFWSHQIIGEGGTSCMLKRIGRYHSLAIRDASFGWSKNTTSIRPLNFIFFFRFRTTKQNFPRRRKQLQYFECSSHLAGPSFPFLNGNIDRH